MYYEHLKAKKEGNLTRQLNGCSASMCGVLWRVSGLEPDWQRKRGMTLSYTESKLRLFVSNPERTSWESCMPNRKLMANGLDTDGRCWSCLRIQSCMCCVWTVHHVPSITEQIFTEGLAGLYLIWHIYYGNWFRMEERNIVCRITFWQMLYFLFILYYWNHITSRKFLPFLWQCMSCEY